MSEIEKKIADLIKNKKGNTVLIIAWEILLELSN